MTEVLERLARERAETLDHESKALTGEAEGFLVFARDNCDYVGFLLFLWQIMLIRLHRGGVPANRFVQECDVLLTRIAGPEHFLGHILRVWHERDLPIPLAESIFKEVKAAQERLNLLAEEVKNLGAKVAVAPRGLSADPALLEQRIKKADENREWVPLRARPKE